MKAIEKLLLPCGPAGPHELVLPLLKSYGLTPEVRVLDGEDGYRQLMLGVWRERKPVIIVEHDILPWPGAIEELIACPCLWGTYSYRCHGGIGISHMLGCAKITAELIDLLPDLWDSPVHWAKIDGHLFFGAERAGQQPHLHRPAVIHLNPRELA